MFYAGDEYADDDATSGPWSEELDDYEGVMAEEIEWRRNMDGLHG